MLDALKRRWPAMLVSINDGERQHEFSRWRAGAGALPESRGDVMVARDSALRDAWDEHGYFTDRTGRGPLAIYYEPCEKGLIKTVMQEEPYRREPQYGFSPFDALLLGDGCSVLTIVTPDGAPHFRDEVLGLLRQAVAEKSELA
ncbi:hypothetical protein [Micromonospora cathayae]|uniref:MmyB-like transcription regulator ligand binding domain-containing protein n=1 Tax=Micromonospora cathayae TaxID=3028804 RepID=A0ABY7ZQD4_9ACTN|nr:hypothetical protein [Micromonospora sp. HUAS 3]WDZ84084.1 hypothetical protein PVK37_27070 [Micromonospora sp. HUAS 3]